MSYPRAFLLVELYGDVINVCPFSGKTNQETIDDEDDDDDEDDQDNDDNDESSGDEEDAEMDMNFGIQGRDA